MQQGILRRARKPPRRRQYCKPARPDRCPVANSSPSPLRDARVAGSRAPIASLVVPYFSTGKSKPFANLVQSGLGSQSDGIEQELYQVRAVACSAVETRQFSACGATG